MSLDSSYTYPLREFTSRVAFINIRVVLYKIKHEVQKRIHIYTMRLIFFYRPGLRKRARKRKHVFVSVHVT